MIRRIAVILALALALPAPFAAAAQRNTSSLEPFLSSVKKTVLPNGLTVLTYEQKGSGVVAINTWVKAGYFHEPDEVAGMAHLFEHMFFKGSKKFPRAGQIAQELSSVGAQTNAGTIYDSTDYYFVIPREGFLRGMEIQSDALINPLFDEAELKKEAEVVIEESNRKFDNANSVAGERMLATSFVEHRIRRWRIGSNEVLRNIRRDDLLAFFNTLYRPENVIVSIAGDVTHSEAIAAAKSTFGKLPKGKLVKKGGPAEPAQKEFRYGSSSADIRQGYSVLGWHTVGVGHEDGHVLDVLGDILGSGRSSRLYRNVLAPEAAATVNAAHFSFEDVGIFAVTTSFDEKNRNEVDRRILREVARIRQHGPTAYELQLAKNRIESRSIFRLEDALGQAQMLSQAEARGGYRKIGEYLQNVNAVTEQQVKNAAAKYLTRDKLTLYHYRPTTAGEEMTRERALTLVDSVLAEKFEPPAEGPKASAEPTRISGATKAKPVQQLTLANGATLVVEERPGAPLVTAGIYFRGGRTEEHSGNAGITQLMTRAMRKGTATRSGEEIDRSIEFLGTQLGTTTREDFFGFTLQILQRNLAPGLELLADVVLNPSFPEAGVAEEKHLQRGSIKRSYDSADQRPMQLGFEALYGKHPYALPADGYPISLASIDAAELREWWNTHVNARDALIVMVGDISADAAKKLVEQAFGKLPARAESIAAVTPPPAVDARMETIEYRDRKQSAIFVAYPTVTRDHPDYPSLRLLGTVTSGLAGTFFTELRGRQSLAYTVFAGDSSRVHAGSFFAYMASDASKEEQARTALLTEIRKLASDGFTEDDVARARSSFAGSTRINLASNSARRNDYAENHFYGLGLGFTDELLTDVQKLKAEDLRAVSKKYLTGDKFVTAILRGSN